MSETEKSFAQQLFEAARRAAESEAGKRELEGKSREQFIDSMKALTDALDSLPQSTSLHVFLLAVSYLRNAITETIRANEEFMKQNTGGSA